MAAQVVALMPRVLTSPVALRVAAIAAMTETVKRAQVFRCSLLPCRPIFYWFFLSRRVILTFCYRLFQNYFNNFDTFATCYCLFPFKIRPFSSRKLPYGYADIDECAVNNGGCNAEATCSNTVGSFSCTCTDGYEGDGVTCTGYSVYGCLVFLICFILFSNWLCFTY